MILPNLKQNVEYEELSSFGFPICHFIFHFSCMEGWRNVIYFFPMQCVGLVLIYMLVLVHAKTIACVFVCLFMVRMLLVLLEL